MRNLLSKLIAVPGWVMASLRSHPKVALPPLILALAAVIVVILVIAQPRMAKVVAPERIWAVDTLEVTVGDIQPELALFGEVVAGREIDLRAFVPGEVLEVGENFREGGVIAQGDLLVAIDPFEYRAALDERQAQLSESRARLNEIRARLKQFRDDFRRAQNLASQGNVSAKFLAKSRSDMAAEAARAEQQKAVIARLEVGVRRARRNLQKSRLIAPFDGFVHDVAADVGKRVNSNDRVGGLIDADRMEVRFSMSNSQYGRILAASGDMEGRDAKIIWRVGGGDITFHAVVERVGARIAAAKGGVDVYARIKASALESASDKALRPGAFVEVSLPDRAYSNVVRVPSTALHEETGGSTVYVVRDFRLEPRAVEVAARIADDLLVSGDLDDGDVVVTTEFPGIGPGIRVDVR